MVVHGGGPQTTALQHELGQTPRKVAGRRITDEATLAALQMAVGKVNVDLCAALIGAGARAVGIHGAVVATRRPPRAYPGSDELVDLGLVGDVAAVDRALFAQLDGYVPVVACVGIATGGQVYNINADVVASRLAVELNAEALVLVSDIQGVLDGNGDRIPMISEQDSRTLIANGVVTEGMIPKLQEAFDAIHAGVARVHIVGSEIARSLDAPGSVGTTLC